MTSQRAALSVPLLLLAVVVCTVVQSAHARPYRPKRSSDMRLADIETRLGLNGISGILKPGRVAHGVLNPVIIGRRRRSADELRRFEGPLRSEEFGLDSFVDSSELAVPEPRRSLLESEYYVACILFRLAFA